jgi:hypothetical protein
LRRIGGRGEYRAIEWIRRGRKSSWEGEQWIIEQDKRESEGAKKRE